MLHSSLSSKTLQDSEIGGISDKSLPSRQEFDTGFWTWDTELYSTVCQRPFAKKNFFMVQASHYNLHSDNTQNKRYRYRHLQWIQALDVVSCGIKSNKHRNHYNNKQSNQAIFTVRKMK